VESHLAKSVAIALNSGISDQSIQQYLCFFANLMRIRVPAFKRIIEKSHEEPVRSELYTMKRKGEFQPIDLGGGISLGVDDIKIVIMNWRLLQVMTEMAAVPSVLSLWQKLNMSLLHAPKGHNLLTCDNPVAFYRKDATRSDNYGTGMDHPNVEISLPLSRSALLKFSWKEEPVDAHMTAEDVLEFNRRTVVMAEKVIFAPAQSEEFQRLVSDHSHCKAGFRVDTLHHSSGLWMLTSHWPVMPDEEYKISTKSEKSTGRVG